MSSDDKYGGPSGANNTTIEYAENALINGVAGKKVFSIDLPPTAQTNSSQVLAYTGSNLTTVTKTINGVEYQQTLSYDGSNNLTGISSWVQL